MARRKLNLTDQDKAEMQRLYVADGVGIVDIGTRFTNDMKPVSASTVSRILREQGVDLRRRGTRSKVTETVEVEQTENVTFSM